MEKTEIILHLNGKLTERTVRERELDAGQSILDGLTETVTRKVRDVLSIPDWGVAHAHVGHYDTLWSIPIKRVPLYARFRMVGGVLVPMFHTGNDPEMPLVWTPPTGLRLVFGVLTRVSPEDGLVIDGNWLFALDAQSRAYRLPLPNLYDDCRLCTGDFGTAWKTVQECLVGSLDQFNRSKWNSDLMRTVEQSQKFFRFAPDNETFHTLPVQAEAWSSLCEKVSTTLVERIVV